MRTPFSGIVFDMDTLAQAFAMLHGAIDIYTEEIDKLQSKKVLSYFTLGKQARLLRKVSPLLARLKFLTSQLKVYEDTPVVVE